MFRKYLTLVKQSYLLALAYRSEVFLWMFLDVFPLAILFAIWTSIFQNSTLLSGYSLASILQYYFLVTIINCLTSAHFEQGRVLEIREGKIDFFLIRPLSYLFELFLKHIGARLFYITFSLPLFVVIYVLLSNAGHVALPTPSVAQGLVFLTLLVFGFLAEFFLATIIVLIGFWLEHSEGLEHFKWIIITVFSGWMFPLEMMPQWLRRVIETLPFHYFYAVPVAIVQGTRQLHATDVLYPAYFLIGLYVLIRIMWKKAQYRYSSAGG